MRDLLDAKKISWKYYAVKVYRFGNPKASGAGIWSAFDAIDAVRHSKEWGTNVMFNPNKIFDDIKTGRLPAVSWITPDGRELRPSGRSSMRHAARRGSRRSSTRSVRANIGRAARSSCFGTIRAAFTITCRRRSTISQGGLGFRFPMIIISPYVQAHVEHTQYETTSVLRFIEDNWGLTLGQEDQRATGIENAFNFNQTPRPFQSDPGEIPHARSS